MDGSNKHGPIAPIVHDTRIYYRCQGTRTIMGAVSKVERKLLESVRHTNAASMLASLHESSGHNAPLDSEEAQSLSGWKLPDGGNDQEIALTDGLPTGEQLAAVRTSRISKTTSSLPPDFFYPIDCWDRFAAYPLSKDGAGRVSACGSCPLASVTIRALDRSIGCVGP
jgi:hypothetical protein